MSEPILQLTGSGWVFLQYSTPNIQTLKTITINNNNNFDIKINSLTMKCDVSKKDSIISSGGNEYRCYNQSCWCCLCDNNSFTPKPSGEYSVNNIPSGAISKCFNATHGATVNSNHNGFTNLSVNTHTFALFDSLNITKPFVIAKNSEVKIYLRFWSTGNIESAHGNDSFGVSNTLGTNSDFSQNLLSIEWEPLSNINVYTNNQWRQGKAWVCTAVTNNIPTWKEAQEVYVCTNTNPITWKKSIT